VIRLEVEIPPSWGRVNRRYKGRKYRLSDHYKAYKAAVKEACEDALAQGAQPLVEEVAVTLHVHCEAGKTLDVDAVVKPTLDAMQKGGLFGDDKQVVRLTVLRYDNQTFGMVIATVGDA